jgi:hypothetical protein
LQPTFREAIRKQRAPLYWRWDPHWTEAGHALAAMAMAPFLADVARACGNGNEPVGSS